MRRPAAKRRGAGVLVLAVLLAGSLAGCSTARLGLGTGSSQCFRALAPAADAVHDRGGLAGVRLVPARGLSHHRDRVDDLVVVSPSPIRAVCLVAYRGEFRLDQVTDPLGHSPRSGTGPYALVVVSSPQNHVLGTFVLDHLPIRIRHDLIGGV